MEDIVMEFFRWWTLIGFFAVIWVNPGTRKRAMYVALLSGPVGWIMLVFVPIGLMINKYEKTGKAKA